TSCSACWRISAETILIRQQSEFHLRRLSAEGVHPILAPHFSAVSRRANRKIGELPQQEAVAPPAGFSRAEGAGADDAAGDPGRTGGLRLAHGLFDTARRTDRPVGQCVFCVQGLSLFWRAIGPGHRPVVLGGRDGQADSDSGAVCAGVRGGEALAAARPVCRLCAGAGHGSKCIAAAEKQSEALSILRRLWQAPRLNIFSTTCRT